jgi:hypothetical protein
VQAILWPIVSWLLRQIVIKFLVLGVIYEALVLLVPLAAGLVTPFISTSSLTSLFGALPDSMYFFFYLFRLDVGFPLVISANIAAFTIRRIPFIG